MRKEKFTNSCEYAVEIRKTSIDYILHKIDKDPVNINESSLGINITTYYISEHATYNGDKFKSDNDTMFTLLKNDLKYTSGWNYITGFKRDKNGRVA